MGSIVAEFSRTVHSLDLTKDANGISRQIIGDITYWKNPAFKTPNGQMQPRDIEIKLLSEAGLSNWKGESVVGKPYYVHFLTLMRILLPRTDITPDAADIVRLFCSSPRMAKKILNLLGSQNSGKSGITARVAVTLMAIMPREAAIYVANPFNVASDATIWGEFTEVFQQAHERAADLWPDFKVYESKRILLIKGSPKAGHVSLRNIKNVGIFKGTKTTKKTAKESFILIIIDEVNEIQNMAFLRVLSNLSSQEGLFVITSQNFKSANDMGGRLAQPSPEYGGPGDYDELDPDIHLLWDSAYSGTTIRLDGLSAPNIVAGRTIYSYLFKQENLEFQRTNFGEMSPEWFEQVRSFPVRGDGISTCLSQSAVREIKAVKMPHRVLLRMGRVSFCDPAFGGKDRPTWGWADVIQAELQRFNSTTAERCHLIVVTEPVHILDIDLTLRMDGKWSERIGLLGFSPRSNFDSTVPLVKPEVQVAVQCSELNMKHGIPAINFGYDFSMRPEMMTAVNTYVGSQAQAWAYNGKPVGDAFLSFLNLGTDVAVYDRRSELAFMASDVVLSDQLRGGALIPEALDELSRTLFKVKGDKRRIEDKQDYKDRNSGTSPDFRDWWIGIVGMAHKIGFRTLRSNPSERDLRHPDTASMMAVIKSTAQSPSSHVLQNLRQTVSSPQSRGIGSRWGIRSSRR